MTGCWRLTSRRVEGGLIELKLALHARDRSVAWTEIPLIDPTDHRQVALAARTVTGATGGTIGFSRVIRELRLRGAK